MLAMTCQKN